MVLLLIKNSYADALLLSAALVSVKLSAWPLAVVSFIFFVAYRAVSWKNLMLSPQLMLTALLVTFWQLNGFFLSGTLLFPAISATFPVPWAMSAQHITDARESVIWWARYPGMHHGVAKTLGHAGWLLRTIFQLLAQQLFILSTLGLLLLVQSSWRNSKKYSKQLLLLLIPALGLVSFIMQAPDIRLAGVWFAVLMAIVVYLLYEITPARKMVVWAMLLVISIGAIQLYVSLPSVNPFQRPEYPPSGAVEKLNTNSILTNPNRPVFIPIPGDDKCSFAPLPCVLGYDVGQYSHVKIDFETHQIETTR